GWRLRGALAIGGRAAAEGPAGPLQKWPRAAGREPWAAAGVLPGWITMLRPGEDAPHSRRGKEPSMRHRKQMKYRLSIAAGAALVAGAGLAPLAPAQGQVGQ